MIIQCEVCGKEVRKLKPTQRCCSKACFEIARQRRTDERYSGQRFGMLTVLRRDDSKRTAYICRCDCGNETSVRAGHLTSNGQDRTLSCGCHRQKVGKRMGQENGIGRRNELEPGARYGRFTVLEFDHVGTDGATWHKVRCVCGNEKIVRTASLLSGSSKSCGCLHREVSAETLRKAAFKHGMSNERAYLVWLQRQRYRDEKQWTYQMEAALRNSQPVCVVCGSADAPTVDHVFPFSRGGAMVPGNVVMLCKSCNSSKHDRLLDELSEDVARKISDAAYEFLEYWNSLNTT